MHKIDGRSEKCPFVHVCIRFRHSGFYTDLEKLLAGQTDAKSRKTLAEGYFQLAELTDKIGSKTESLAVHRFVPEWPAPSGATVCSPHHCTAALLFVRRPFCSLTIA
jgi:hypothetical protein